MEEEMESMYKNNVMMARGVISWKSVNQLLTLTFIIETKYVACYKPT